jgi:hypothetical protein
MFLLTYLRQSTRMESLDDSRPQVLNAVYSQAHHKIIANTHGEDEALGQSCGIATQETGC